MSGIRYYKCRVILIGMLILICPPALVGADLEKSPEKITIGYMTVPNPLTVAKELAWFERSLDIPVEWVKFESGSHVIKAISRGEIDLTHIGSTPCAAGIANGLPIEVLWVSAVIADGEALVVRDADRIEKLSDLAGKKVATPFESTSHYSLKVALKLDNIKENQIKVINLDPEQIMTAWMKKEIQAGYVWDPVKTRMVESGGKVILSSKELALRGFPTADLFVARKDFAEKHSNLVLAAVKDLNRAAQLSQSDPNQAAEAVSRGLGISLDQALVQMQGMIFLTAAEQKAGLYIGKLKWEFGLYTLLKDAADFLEAEGAIENSPPWPAFARAINPGFIEEIYRKIKRPKY